MVDADSGFKSELVIGTITAVQTNRMNPVSKRIASITSGKRYFDNLDNLSLASRN